MGWTVRLVPQYRHGLHAREDVVVSLVREFVDYVFITKEQDVLEQIGAFLGRLR